MRLPRPGERPRVSLISHSASRDRSGRRALAARVPEPGPSAPCSRSDGSPLARTCRNCSPGAGRSAVRRSLSSPPCKRRPLWSFRPSAPDSAPGSRVLADRGAAVESPSRTQRPLAGCVWPRPAVSLTQNVLRRSPSKICKLFRAGPEPRHPAPQPTAPQREGAAPAHCLERWPEPTRSTASRRDSRPCPTPRARRQSSHSDSGKTGLREARGAFPRADSRSPRAPPPPASIVAARHRSRCRRELRNIPRQELERSLFADLQDLVRRDMPKHLPLAAGPAEFDLTDLGVAAKTEVRSLVGRTEISNRSSAVSYTHLRA